MMFQKVRRAGAAKRFVASVETLVVLSPTSERRESLGNSWVKGFEMRERRVLCVGSD